MRLSIFLSIRYFCRIKLSIRWETQALTNFQSTAAVVLDIADPSALAFIDVDLPHDQQGYHQQDDD